MKDVTLRGGAGGKWYRFWTCAVIAGMALLTGLSGTPAHACYTGLVNIPSAEVVGPGQYGIELQLDGNFADGSADTRIVNTELGLGPRFEAGVDLDLSRDAETKMLLNAKYLLVGEDEKPPALAAGICNLGRHLSAMPYLVAKQPLSAFQLHLGLARIADHDRWFVGLTHEVDDRLTLMADCTSGSDNIATVGFGYQFTDRFGIMAGVILPNSYDEDTGFTVHLVWSGPYRRMQKEQ